MGTPNLYIGGSGASSGAASAYDEQIDAVGWWGRKLEDSEIADLYAAGAGWEPPLPADNTPDAFSFADVTDADLSTVYVSDSQVITGMDAGTAISITDGEYRIDGGAWASGAGTINPGQTLELRQTSSGTPETKTTATVTVGTVAVDWDVTTAIAAGNALRIVFGQQQLLLSAGWKVIPG
jgi:hypothetical protein